MHASTIQWKLNIFIPRSGNKTKDGAELCHLTCKVSKIGQKQTLLILDSFDYPAIYSTIRKGYVATFFPSLYKSCDF